MTISLKFFDEKIADLKQKKKNLEAKQAQHLLKYLSTQIGNDFSPQLAACVVKESWEGATPDQKEKWLKAAKTFRFSSARSVSKSDSKNATSPQQNTEKKA